MNIRWERCGTDATTEQDLLHGAKLLGRQVRNMGEAIEGACAFYESLSYHQGGGQLPDYHAMLTLFELLFNQGNVKVEELRKQLEALTNELCGYRETPEEAVKNSTGNLGGLVMADALGETP